MDEKLKKIYREYFPQGDALITDSEEINKLKEYENKNGGNLPKGYDKNNPYYFKKNYDFSPEEMQAKIFVSQAKNIKTIKNILMFYFVLNIIGVMIFIFIWFLGLFS